MWTTSCGSHVDCIHEFHSGAAQLPPLLEIRDTQDSCIICLMSQNTGQMTECPSRCYCSKVSLSFKKRRMLCSARVKLKSPLLGWCIHAKIGSSPLVALPYRNTVALFLFPFIPLNKAFQVKRNTYLRPPSSLMALVLKLVWQPAPFQFPGMGLGSKDTMTPKSSQTLWRMNRAIQRWSPISIPSQGPTWNSHWKSREHQFSQDWRGTTTLRDAVHTLLLLIH